MNPRRFPSSTPTLTPSTSPTDSRILLHFQQRILLHFQQNCRRLFLRTRSIPNRRCIQRSSRRPRRLHALTRALSPTLRRMRRQRVQHERREHHTRRVRPRSRRGTHAATDRVFNCKSDATAIRKSDAHSTSHPTLAPSTRIHSTSCIPTPSQTHAICQQLLDTPRLLECAILRDNSCGMHLAHRLRARRRHLAAGRRLRAASRCGGDGRHTDLASTSSA